MKKIKKGYNVKIIAVFVVLVFGLNTITYGIGLSYKINLRVPLITAEFTKELEESLKQRSAIDILLKKLSSVKREDMAWLISDILLIVNLDYSIKECLNKGRAYQGGLTAIEAIKNNIQGITPELVTKSINERLNKGRPDQAGLIGIEAIKNDIQAATPELVIKWINEWLNKDTRSDQAGLIAIEAIKNNMKGITPELVTRWINECLNKGWPDQARLIAIEAIKNNIPDAKPEVVTEWINEFFNKKNPYQAGQIAIEAIKNNIRSVTPELVIKSINECFNKDRPDQAGLIAIWAIKNNIKDIMPEVVMKSINECPNKGKSYQAGQVAIEAIKNNIEGITPELVTKWINECLNKDKPDQAGQIAIEAIKNNIKGIAPEFVTKWINECLNKKRQDQAGLIAIEAIKNKILGITSELVIKSINECFNKGWPYQAGLIAMEAIKNNVQGIEPDVVIKSIGECFDKDRSDQAMQIAIEAIKNNMKGITPELVTEWISECLNKNEPYQAVQIAIEAIKNNIPDAKPEVVTEWINECFNKDRPDQAGQIAIEALKMKTPSRNAQSVLNLLKDPAIFTEDGLDFIARVTCYALQAGGGLNDLYMILPSLKRNKHIFNMLRTFVRHGGYDVITKEIFENKGIEHFVILYNNIYKNVFNDLLPDELNIIDKRTNLLLRHLVHFDVSEFARNDLTFEKIYNDYKEAYTRGEIKVLPATIPKPRIIEVPTKKARSIIQDAQAYYNSMIGSMKKALSIINSSQKGQPLFKSSIEELIISITQEISNLKVKIAGDGLSRQAKENIDRDLNMLNEVISIIGPLKENDIFPLEKVGMGHLKAMSKIKNIGATIRLMLFTHALHNNPNWQVYFKEHIEEPISLINMVKFIEFIDSFIKPHLLENMEKKTREKLLIYTSTMIFNKELDRIGQRKTQFTKRIKLVPLRGWIAEFIGYFSDECWTGTLNIMRDNPDAIVLVMVDDDTNELLGGTLLLLNSIKGEKVLIDRGLSPRTEITAGLNVDDFVSKVSDYEEEIARVLGATKILVPMRSLESGLGTNNPDIIQYYDRMLSNNSSIDLDKPSIFNGHDVAYGKCVVLRDFSLKDVSLALPDRKLLSDL